MDISSLPILCLSKPLKEFKKSKSKPMVQERQNNNKLYPLEVYIIYITSP